MFLEIENTDSLAERLKFLRRLRNYAVITDCCELKTNWNLILKYDFDLLL